MTPDAACALCQPNVLRAIANTRTQWQQTHPTTSTSNHDTRANSTHIAARKLTGSMQHLQEIVRATDCRRDGAGELVVGQVRKPAGQTGSFHVTQCRPTLVARARHATVPQPVHTTDKYTAITTEVWGPGEEPTS
jgi:hypothetical protein